MPALFLLSRVETAGCCRRGPLRASVSAPLLGACCGWKPWPESFRSASRRLGLERLVLLGGGRAAITHLLAEQGGRAPAHRRAAVLLGGPQPLVFHVAASTSAENWEPMLEQTPARKR